MEVLRRFIHILACISYVFISLYVLLVVPMLFGFKPVVILSGSMIPTYEIGTVIYYSKVDDEDIKENDVITFITDNQQVVTHRVYQLRDDKIMTKGDANNAPDSRLVEYDNVIGKVAPISIPYVGYYVSFVNENLYLVIGVVVILVLEFVLSNFNIEKEEESERYEKNKK